MHCFLLGCWNGLTNGYGSIAMCQPISAAKQKAVHMSESCAAWATTWRQRLTPHSASFLEAVKSSVSSLGIKLRFAQCGQPASCLQQLHSVRPFREHEALMSGRGQGLHKSCSRHQGCHWGFVRQHCGTDESTCSHHPRAHLASHGPCRGHLLDQADVQDRVHDLPDELVGDDCT